VKLGLNVWEEHRLKVSENTMLRRIFGCKSEEIAGGWKKLHNEEHHYFYSSPDIIESSNQEG
jgi:hypothetical protein